MTQPCQHCQGREKDEIFFSKISVASGFYGEGRDWNEERMRTTLEFTKAGEREKINNKESQREGRQWRTWDSCHRQCGSEQSLSSSEENKLQQLTTDWICDEQALSAAGGQGEVETERKGGDGVAIIYMLSLQLWLQLTFHDHPQRHTFNLITFHRWTITSPHHNAPTNSQCYHSVNSTVHSTFLNSSQKHNLPQQHFMGHNPIWPTEAEDD